MCRSDEAVEKFNKQGLKHDLSNKLKAIKVIAFPVKVVPVGKAVNREDKPSRRYRDRDIAKFESSRRYRQR